MMLALLTSGMVVGAPASGSTQTLLPGVADLTIDIVSMPQTVAPPGALVVYQVTVENAGLLPATGFEVEAALEEGFEHRQDLSSDECSGSGSLVTCESGDSLAPGASRAFDVVAHTPAEAGTYTARAVVSATGPLASLEFTGNNDDEAITLVESDSSAGVSGLVQGGQSTTFDAGDGRLYILEVPESVPGVIVSIAARAGADHLCGAGPCGDGFHTDFEDHPRFRADDPADPLVATKTFGPQDPCRGISACTGIYFAKDPDAAVLEPMPSCPGRGGGSSAGNGEADPSPCLNRIFKVKGEIWFDVRMTSTDPLVLPPVLGGLTG